MNTLRTDLLYARRSLSRQRGFSLVVVPTLALGIGGTVAIFSTVQSRLFRASPFRDADRLVRITSVRSDKDRPVAVPEQDDLIRCAQGCAPDPAAGSILLRCAPSNRGSHLRGHKAPQD